RPGHQPPEVLAPMISARSWYSLRTSRLASAIILLFTQRARGVSALISVLAVIVSFVCASFLFVRAEIKAAQIPWIDFPGILRVPTGFPLYQLSKTMLVLVTRMGGLIHIYLLSYLRHARCK